jgi:hypothetical protein
MNPHTAQEAEMNTSMALKVLLGTAALTLPLMASAASTYTTGSTNLSAAATVNLQVVIQKVLYLRVGTGSLYATGALATGGAPDLITFNAPLNTVGTSVSGTGGDLTGGVETAAVVSNGGSSVALVASTNANGLSDGGAPANYIPFTQIKTTASAAAITAGYQALGAPQLNGTGGSTTVNLTPTAGKIITADAQWTYTYNNSAAYPAGTYGGTTALNGTVTYTATMP